MIAAVGARALAQPADAAWVAADADAISRTILAVVVVLGLLALGAWLLRRGAFSSFRRRGPISVESAAPLGDRRSLAIVVVEGRRLLLGLTPTQVSLVAELGPAQEPFTQALDRSIAGGSGPAAS